MPNFQGWSNNKNIINEKYALLPRECQGSVTYVGLLVQEVFSDSRETVNQLVGFLLKCKKGGICKMYQAKKENVIVACRVLLVVVTRLVELCALPHDYMDSILTFFKKDKWRRLVGSSLKLKICLKLLKMKKMR